MLVHNVSIANSKYSNNNSFKSVYPVYHWCKIDGKYKPATQSILSTHCQRLFAGLLNKGGRCNLEIPSNLFIQKIARYLASIDSDYKSIPYVRSFYNNNGGFKNTPEKRGIEPMVYLLTGSDAVDFEQMFGKPLGASKYSDSVPQEIINDSIKRARASYAMVGPMFVKSRLSKFKETHPPLELHTIFMRSIRDKKRHLELYKCEFFKQGDSNNPLIKNGIIDP